MRGAAGAVKLWAEGPDLGSEQAGDGRRKAGVGRAASARGEFGFYSE